MTKLTYKHTSANGKVTEGIKTWFQVLALLERTGGSYTATYEPIPELTSCFKSKKRVKVVARPRTA